MSNKDFTLDKWIAQELDIKPMHLDFPVVSNGIPVTLLTIDWSKKRIFLSTKDASRSLLQRYLVGSRYKYIPNDTAEVTCNTHLDKLPTKPKKFLGASLDSFSEDKFKCRGKKLIEVTKKYENCFLRQKY